MIKILQFAIMEDSEEMESLNIKTLWFYIFIGKIIKLRKFYINPIVCYMAVIKLLEKPTFMDNINRDRMIFDLNTSDDEKELEKSEFLLMIVKYCEKELTREQFDELIRIAEISPLYFIDFLLIFYHY